MAGASPPPPNGKMKGILKGLKYISQIFENEKEPEMQIGNPTDVKHVAHIGWDGPALNSAPTWMNEYQGPQAQANQSAPLVSGAEKGGVPPDDTVKWVSGDSKSKRSSIISMDSSSRELPKSSRRSSGGGSGGGSGASPAREKSDKPRQSRRPSKLSKEKDGEGSGKPRKPKDPNQESEIEIDQKCRRKKSKDASVGGGSSRRARQKDSDCGSDAGSVTKNRSRELCQPSDIDFEEEEKRLSRVL